MSLHDEVTSIRPPPRAEPTQIVRTRPSAASLPTLQRLRRRRRNLRAAAIGAVIVVIGAIGAAVVLWLGPAPANATHKPVPASAASAASMASTASTTSTPAAAYTGVASTGVASTGVASTGVASTGVASTGVASTGVASTGVASTGVANAAVTDTGAEVEGNSAAETSPDAVNTAHKPVHRPHAASTGGQAPLQPLPEAPRLLSARVQFLKDNCKPRAPTCTTSVAQKWPRWSTMDTNAARDFKAEVDDCVEACARH